MRTLSIAILTALIAGSVSAQKTPGVLRVKAEGLRSDRGQVICELYSSAEGFPAKPEKAVAKVSAAIHQGQASCEFAGLAAGTYAVALIHDENGNGRLDTNFLGIPREGVGATNNARSRFGPPKFDEAAFHYTGGVLELVVKMGYL